MIDGDTRPKHFRRIIGDERQLTQTRRRISLLFDPDQSYRRRYKRIFYSRELNEFPQTAVIAQPENRGTGVAIATAILMLRDLDPEPIVAAFLCDHDNTDEAAFRNVIEAGIGVAQSSDAIVLVGAEATYLCW